MYIELVVYLLGTVRGEIKQKLKQKQKTPSGHLLSDLDKP